MKKIPLLAALLALFLFTGCEKPLTPEEATALTLTSLSTDQEIPGLLGGMCTMDECNDDSLSYAELFVASGMDFAVLDTPYLQLEALQPMNELYAGLMTPEGEQLRCVVNSDRATELYYALDLCGSDPGEYLLTVSVEFENGDSVGYAYPIVFEEAAQ